MSSMIMVRFGELTLKGNNRSRFEKAVIRDIRSRLSEYPDIRTESAFGRLYMELNGTPVHEVAAKLDTVFGLSSYSPVERCALQPETIRNVALEVMKRLPRCPATFKVTVRRPNKDFPLDSMQMNDYIGGYILSHIPNLRVDVRNPQVELFVEIREHCAYVYGQVVPGLGGYPAATSGKAMLLLSGGIDSPVAGWLALKRGLELEAVHFHSFPFTSERAQRKVKELAERLALFSRRMTLHMVPFTEIQTRLKKAGEDKLLITLIRRAMMRVTNKLAEERYAKAIVTGESLGQVASQTLPSLTVIGQAANLPVLRPLITMDKLEIIQTAEKIGTFPISIQPYEDCCTLFVPKSPSTNPNLKVIERFEQKADWLDELVQDAARRAEAIEIVHRKV